MYKIGMFLINPNNNGFIYAKTENKEIEIISNLDNQTQKKLIKTLYQKI